ncbi:MAG TPA: PBP1A family penicillin-binding protein [Acidimicrobiales bacterium]|nr:PBP1A family penicillin-binding protein [Acidimicrobiales bacterium]
MRRASAFLLLAVLTAGACSWETPPLKSTVPAPLAESSRILAADGSVVTALHGEENRETVPLARMPVALRQAVVAIEDERFWEHKGVDTRSVLRAVYANAAEGEVVEGGSTITQQYVKNELVGPDRTLRRKLREASLAYQLERRYTKERILELYLNTIYFGNGAYGVQAAANEYFGIAVDQLGLAQAALLAGLIRAPNRTDPYLQPEVAAARRRVVLEKMVELGWATTEQAAAAGAEPLISATPAADRYPAPHFVERVKRFILDDPRFGPTPDARRDLLFKGGLRITTTLDRRRQAAAEAAIARVLSSPETDPAAAVVSIEPGTGFVRALVGGRDFFGSAAEAKFDLATQGSRPAGSAFKPFVLAAALEQHVPVTKFYDAPGTMTIPLPREPWTVSNYEGQGGGRMTLIDATIRSVNTVYAQLILDVGPADAVATAARMGITSPLQPYPSAVLGTNDVTPLEMASAYGTLANRGLAVPPVFVTRVVGSDGRVLFQHQHSQKRVLDRASADVVVDVLRQAVERGTGVKARIGRPVAGKTGTGQEWRDAWFVGFTPELATAVWVGFPDRQRSMVPPATRILVTGGSWPAEIWGLYASEALADVPAGDFPAPPPPEGDASQPVLRLVPPVIGLPAEQAEDALGRDGFLATREPTPSADYPPGYVVGASPDSGLLAPAASTVALKVSSGPVTALVPELAGMTAEQAGVALGVAGLAANVVVQGEPTPGGPARRRGLVWRQSPGASTGATRGATVTVYVNPLT